MIQEALDSRDVENVNQMHPVIDEIYRSHSRGSSHDYEQQLQILDVII